MIELRERLHRDTDGSVACELLSGLESRRRQLEGMISDPSFVTDPKVIALASAFRSAIDVIERFSILRRR